MISLIIHNLVNCSHKANMLKWNTFHSNILHTYMIHFNNLSLSRVLSATICPSTNASKELQRKEMAREKGVAGRSIMTSSRMMRKVKMMKSLLKMRCLKYLHIHPSREDQQRETPRFKLSSTLPRVKSPPHLKLQRVKSSVPSCQHQPQPWTMRSGWPTAFQRHPNLRMRTLSPLYFQWRPSSQKLPSHHPRSNRLFQFWPCTSIILFRASYQNHWTTSRWMIPQPTLQLKKYCQ